MIQQLRDLSEDRYRPVRLAAFDDQGALVRSRVFTLFVRGDVLEGHVLPSGGSYGNLSIGPAGFT